MNRQKKKFSLLNSENRALNYAIQIQHENYSTLARPDQHILALILMLAFWLSIPLALLWQGQLNSTVIYIVAGMYCTMQLESFLSKYFQCLWSILDKQELYEYIKNVRNSPPQISWSCECYHFETESYYENRTITEGSYPPRTRTERVRKTRIVKRVTWTQRENFKIQDHQDISGELVDLPSSLIIVECSSCWGFGNEEVKRRYDVWRDHLINSNKNRDLFFKHYDHSKFLKLRNYILIDTTEEKRSFLIGVLQYIGFSLLGQSWAYRSWLTEISNYSFLSFRKLIF